MSSTIKDDVKLNRKERIRRLQNVYNFEHVYTSNLLEEKTIDGVTFIPVWFDESDNKKLFKERRIAYVNKIAYEFKDLA